VKQKGAENEVLWTRRSRRGLLMATTFQNEGATWLDLRLWTRNGEAPTPLGVTIPVNVVSGLAQALTAYAKALSAESPAKGLKGMPKTKRYLPPPVVSSSGERAPKMPAGVRGIALWEVLTDKGVVRVAERGEFGKHVLDVRLWVRWGHVPTREGITMPCEGAKDLAKHLTAFTTSLGLNGLPRLN